MLSRRLRVLLLAALSASAVIALLCVGPIAQDPAYHAFADAQPAFGLPNGWNVLSNLPFVLVGAFGLLRWRRLRGTPHATACLVLSTAVVLVGFGSAWYHAAPTNDTLLWDRLPLTVAFVAVFHLLLQERVWPALDARHLAMLVAAGAGSVVYWIVSEAHGHGDLRPYVLAQYMPVLLMPLIVLLFPRRYVDDRLMLGAIGLYAIAKTLELGDAEILAVLGISGHTLKHVVAAAAVGCVLTAVGTQARFEAFVADERSDAAGDSPADR